MSLHAQSSHASYLRQHAWHPIMAERTETLPCFMPRTDDLMLGDPEFNAIYIGVVAGIGGASTEHMFLPTGDKNAEPRLLKLDPSIDPTDLKIGVAYDIDFESHSKIQTGFVPHGETTRGVRPVAIEYDRINKEMVMRMAGGQKAFFARPDAVYRHLRENEPAITWRLNRGGKIEAAFNPMTTSFDLQSTVSSHGRNGLMVMGLVRPKLAKGDKPVFS